MITKAPQVSAGQFEYAHKQQRGELICHLEYEAAEDGKGESPKIPAQANLCAAYANGMDILSLLDECYIALIEEQAVATFLE